MIDSEWRDDVQMLAECLSCNHCTDLDGWHANHRCPACGDINWSVNFSARLNKVKVCNTRPVGSK